MSIIVTGARLGASLLLTLLWVVGAHPARGQVGNVTGRVVHAETGEVVVDAQVFVEGTGRSDLSDQQGRFAIAGVGAGTHWVVVERLGFATARQQITVAAGATAQLDFRLSSQAVSIPGIVVTATREARRLDEVAASIGVVGRAELAERRPAHPTEIMSRVAGVWVNVTGGEGHMTSIRHPLTTEPVYLYLEDGVPSRSTGFFNHNALYEINVPQAERIEVMKGPANALYGSDAIGGVVNVQTRPPSDQRSYEASLEGGGHGFARFLGSMSSGVGAGAARADLNYTRTDGWRNGTGYDRWSGTLRWDVAFAGGASLKTVAAYSNIDQQTAGASAISRGDFESNPTLNYTPISWRKVTALRLSTEAQATFGGVSLALTPYLRSNSMDILPNWSLTFDPAVWETSNLSFGVLAKVRKALPALNGDVIAGVDVDVSPGEHRERVISPVRQGSVFVDYSEGAPIYDYEVTFKQASPYAQLELEPLTGLRMSAGVRVDAIGYDYQNHMDVVQTGPHRRPADASPSFVALSPKLGVTYRLSEGASVFGAFRRGFRAPAEGQLFRQGSAEGTVDLDPVVSSSYEVGVRGLLARRVRYEATVYHMPMFDEILGFVLPSGATETVNAGETLHRGVELGLGVALPAGLTMDASWSFAEHTYRAWSPRTGVDYSGNTMDSAPATLGNVDVSWTPPPLPAARLGFTWTHMGPFWMDQTNENEYEGHDLIDARASYNFPRGVAAFLRVNNLADARYAERATFNAFRGQELAPGLPRTFYAGVEIR